MQDRGIDLFFASPQRGGQDKPYITCDRQYLYDYPNNIIVFSGERGAGKSSAMLTFVSSLTDNNSLLFQDEFLSSMVACELPNVSLEAAGKMLKTCRFVEVAPVDPTTLEDDGQILTVILARMFRLAASVWEKSADSFGQRTSPGRLDEKNKLIEKFSTCYEHIQSIKRSGEPKPEYAGLETLAELGDSSRLKVELSELVERLLRFCLPDAGDSSHLVLQIDDTDMNIKKAYVILEDIRRYLVIPRLIIVMAADLKHLAQVVESSLLKNYDDSLNDRNAYVEKITHQYITKLFPQTRQIDLPSLGTYLREHADSVSIRYKISEKVILPDEKGEQFHSYQDQIIRLIYRKTGMVFLKQKHCLHPIIPCNMRLLAHFLSMLVQMEDVEDPDAENPGYFLRHPSAKNTYESHAKKLGTRLQNIQRFRNYFLSSWVNNSLENSSVQLFKDLEQTDVTDRIHYICVRLDKLWKKEQKNASNPDGENIIRDGSYADMVRICLEITAKSWNKELKRLVFALQTYCSLFVHTLALEDLIDYYENLARMKDEEAKQTDDEQQENEARPDSENTGLGCSFFRLYAIFGSQLFPYAYIYKNKDENKNKSAVMVSLSDNDDNTMRKKLKRAWNYKKSLSVAGFESDIKQKQHATLLYSMLLEYQSPNRGEAHQFNFDLTRPITNCLYLGDNKGLTPCAGSIEKAERLNVSVMGEDSWHIMRNSALITVLNSDVQMKIGSALQDMELAPESNAAEKESQDSGKPHPDYTDWLALIKTMCVSMTESVGEPVTESESKPLPIAFLGKLDFYKWLEPLSTKGINEQDGSEDWIKIIENLNADVTYNLPPPAAQQQEEAPPLPALPTPDDAEQKALETENGSMETKLQNTPDKLDPQLPGSVKSE